MDREEKKRRQKILVVFAEAMMVLAVVGIVIVMTLVAMGFKFGRDGNIEQSGLMQLHTLPTGATVELDGETLFARTDLSRTLSPGEHYIKVTKDGYDSWEKTVTMRSGWLMRLYYPRLFLNERTTEKIGAVPETEFYSVSDDRNSILYAATDSATWQLLNIKGDAVESKSLDFSGVLTVDAEKKMMGAVEEVTWSEDGNRVLVKMDEKGTKVWYLLDLKRVKDSVNLSKEYGLDFDEMRLANAGAGVILALENGNLRKLDVDGRSMTRILVSEVAEFMNHGTDVVFVTRASSNGVRKIGVQLDTAKGSVIVREVGTEEGAVHVATSAYYDDDYLIYTVGSEMTIYQGEYPRFESEADVTTTTMDLEKEGSPMKQYYKGDLGVIGEKIEVSRGGEYIVVHSGQDYAVVDLDNVVMTQYVSETGATQWLDDSMMYGLVNGELKVWDFDGENLRWLTGGVKNLAVGIASNNKYLYYVETNGALVREQIQ